MFCFRRFIFHFLVDMSTQEKAQMLLVTLMKAEFHLAEPVPGLGLTWSSSGPSRVSARSLLRNLCVSYRKIFWRQSRMKRSSRSLFSSPPHEPNRKSPDRKTGGQKTSRSVDVKQNVCVAATKILLDKQVSDGFPMRRSDQATAGHKAKSRGNV